MIPIEKVKLIVNTYATLEKELASGDINKKDFVKKSKEYSSIGQIIDEYNKVDSSGLITISNTDGDLLNNISDNERDWHKTI